MTRKRRPWSRTKCRFRPHRPYRRRRRGQGDRFLRAAEKKPEFRLQVSALMRMKERPSYDRLYGRNTCVTVSSIFTTTSSPDSQRTSRDLRSLADANGGAAAVIGLGPKHLANGRNTWKPWQGLFAGVAMALPNKRPHPPAAIISASSIQVSSRKSITMVMPPAPASRGRPGREGRSWRDYWPPGGARNMLEITSICYPCVTQKHQGATPIQRNPLI